MQNVIVELGHISLFNYRYSVMDIDKNTLAMTWCFDQCCSKVIRLFIEAKFTNSVVAFMLSSSGLQKKEILQ